MSYAVFVEGLGALSGLEEIKRDIEIAAVRAINKTADHARTLAAREMRQQVAFPPSYLSPSGGRLTVSQKARGGALEARIKGRHRPTSLARFATSVTKKGAMIQVKPGVARFMPKAFLVRLSGGNTDTKGNRGLAIRLKAGETLRNKIKAIRLSNGLYLLYGPSIDQVFRTVSEDISDDTAEFLENEFMRLVRTDF